MELLKFFIRTVDTKSKDKDYGSESDENRRNINVSGG